MNYTILYKCFIPIDTSKDYEPKIDTDIFAVNELEAVELLINQNEYSTKFLPNSISEIPKDIQKKIEQVNRKRSLIQSKLRSGSTNEIRKIRLVFAEIKIDSDYIDERRNGGKYYRVSLKGKRYTINTYKKNIAEFECEINRDTGEVTIKRLIFA